VVLDSAGHAFGGFPHTSGGAGCPIWARAAKLPPDERTQNPFEAVYAIGSGAQYMPEGRGLLGFFPNTGLTFDLAAMRELHEGVRPARFCATAGVADAHARFPQFENGQADVWVFIDGQLKLDRPGLRPEQGPVKFEVEIGPHDRFLTLVATVGVKEQGCHWLVLGDPVLKMASTGSQNTNTVGAAVPPPPQHLENKNGVAVQLPPQLENKDGVAVKLPPQHEDPGQTARKEKPMNGP
jgi:hypothetical protein